MDFLRRILSKVYQEEKPLQRSAGGTDELFTYLFSLVTDQKTLSKYLTALNHIQITAEPQQTLSLLALYHEIETYALSQITSGSLPAVTENTLREAIRRKVNIQKLDYRIRLLFLAGPDQLAALYKVIVTPLISFLLKSLGQKHLQSMIQPLFVKYSVLDQIYQTNDYVDIQLRDTIDVQMTQEQISVACQSIVNLLYGEITRLVGEQNALNLIQEMFEFANNSYDASLMSRLLAILPKGTLQIEHLANLTREELEQKIKDEIIEKAKIKEAQIINNAFLLSIGEGVIAADADRRVLFINQAAERLTGSENKPTLGLLISEIIRLCDETNKPLSPENNPLWQPIDKNQRLSSTYYCLRLDGTRCQVSLTVSSVLINDMANGIVVVFRDVTREKEIERTRLDFLSLVSHELRTPLTTVRWNIEMLISGRLGELNQPALSLLRETLDTNERMNDLVNTYLNISRIESGNLPNEPSSVDLADMISNAAKQLSKQIQDKNIQFSVLIESVVPKEINIDQHLFREVVQNLLANAVTYNSQNGFVKVTGQLKDNILYLSVTDSGIGISLNDQKNLFTRFHKATNATKFDTGHGLGLYIVKSFVERWGGSVYCDSTEGKGSTFTVTIPIK